MLGDIVSQAEPVDIITLEVNSKDNLVAEVLVLIRVLNSQGN